MLTQKSLSTYTTLIANLSLIFSVIFLGWDWRLLFIILWVENVVIGVFNVMKMIAVSFSGKNFMGIVYVPFFTMHYGIFTPLHSVSVFLNSPWCVHTSACGGAT